MLGYLCAYYRYYHPIEFITSFLNNAANEDDIKSGTAYANRVGIKVTMPKWGFSKSEYFFDKEQNIIAKGLSSVKYMSDGSAEELYELAHSKTYNYFVDVLFDIDEKSILNTRQIDILIKIDFFTDFGNQRELLRITDLFYNTFKRGEAKKLKRELIDGTPFRNIIVQYASGTTKNGAEAKFYTLNDVKAILREIETHILSLGIDDLENRIKIKNFADVMGYYGYSSGKEEDRNKLYILDVYPLHRKKDGYHFGYSIITKSIGSGKEARFTVYNRVYNQDPIQKGDIICCVGYIREGQYYKLTSYYKDF